MFSNSNSQIKLTFNQNTLEVVQVKLPTKKTETKTSKHRWRSGLTRWIQDPLSLEAQVRTLHDAILYYMYKGETLSLDGTESVGISLPALMSQTK